MKREPWKVSEARGRRASLVVSQITEWQALAARGRYPRSLHEIVRGALEREYRLGSRRSRTQGK